MSDVAKWVDEKCQCMPLTPELRDMACIDCFQLYRDALIEAAELMDACPVILIKGEPGHAAVDTSSLARWHTRMRKFLEGLDDS